MQECVKDMFTILHVSLLIWRFPCLRCDSVFPGAVQFLQDLGTGTMNYLWLSTFVKNVQWRKRYQKLIATFVLCH